MPRSLAIILVLIALVLTGCEPKDQLDWKIDASSPDVFEAWMEQHRDRMSPELRAEFTQAFWTLVADTTIRDGRQTNRVNLQLCQRLHGQTLRAMLTDAYRVESMAIQTRIALTATLIVSNIQASESLDDRPEIQQRFGQTATNQQAAIETLQARLAEIKRRTRQLAVAEP